MSNFKIVCGTNPKDETIINLDMIVEISLTVDNTISFVRMIDKWGITRAFETDLEHIGDVFDCMERHLNGVIVFSKRFKDRVKDKL